MNLMLYLVSDLLQVSYLFAYLQSLPYYGGGTGALKSQYNGSYGDEIVNVLKLP